MFLNWDLTQSSKADLIFVFRPPALHWVFLFGVLVLCQAGRLFIGPIWNQLGSCVVKYCVLYEAIVYKKGLVKHYSPSLILWVHTICSRWFTLFASSVLTFTILLKGRKELILPPMRSIYIMLFEYAFFIPDLGCFLCFTCKRQRSELT